MFPGHLCYHMFMEPMIYNHIIIIFHNWGPGTLKECFAKQTETVI